MEGLSPRTRGRPPEPPVVNLVPGSIPANAGETASPKRTAIGSRVYPRERGGDPGHSAESRWVRGLSPRTRGRPRLRRRRLPLAGSIPANAGETSFHVRIPTSARVYPRERGGDGVLQIGEGAGAGLSPRTRGRHRATVVRAVRAGYIPANAGETIISWRKRSWDGVYPRERGGDRRRGVWAWLAPGLSPRTRGRRTRLT